MQETRKCCPSRRRTFIDVCDEAHKTSFYTEIQIVANDRQDWCLKLQALYRAKNRKCHKCPFHQGALGIINVTLEINDKEQLEKVIKVLKIPDVISVIRTKH